MPSACMRVSPGRSRDSCSSTAASVLLPAPGGAARNAISRPSIPRCSRPSSASSGTNTPSTSSRAYSAVTFTPLMTNSRTTRSCMLSYPFRLHFRSQ